MNISSTTTTTLSNNSQPLTATAAAIAISMTVLSILILLGNGLVIFVYVKNKYLQVPKNYLILSLAVSDILIGIFAVNFKTLYLISGYWPLGYVACNLWLSIDYVCAQASTLTLLAISLERFLSIRNAVYYRNNVTKKVLKKVVLGIWVVSFMVWCGSIFLFPVDSDKRVVHEGQCHVQFLHVNPILTVITSVVLFYGPITVMIVLYTRLSIILIQRYKEITNKNPRHFGLLPIDGESNVSSPVIASKLRGGKKNLMEKDPESQKEIKEAADEYPTLRDPKTRNNEMKATKPFCAKFNVKNLTVDIEHSSEIYSSQTITSDRTPNSSPLVQKKNMFHRRSTRTQKQFVKHKKAVTLLLLVLLAFAVTCFPYNLFALIWSICYSCISEVWWNFGYTFYYVNSLLNPFCYAFGNKNFKKSFKKVFRDVRQKVSRMFRKHGAE